MGFATLNPSYSTDVPKPGVQNRNVLSAERLVIHPADTQQYTVRGYLEDLRRIVVIFPVVEDDLAGTVNGYAENRSLSLIFHPVMPPADDEEDPPVAVI